MITDTPLARKNKRHFCILAVLSIPLDLIELAVPSFFIYAVCLFAIQQLDWDPNLYLVFFGVYIFVLFISLLIVRFKTKMPIEKILHRNHAYVIKKDSHYQELIDTVSSLVLSLDLQMPELYLIPTDHEQVDHPKANLIAIKEKNRFAIMITDSMLKVFDRYELEALLAIQLELVHSHYLTNYQILHLLYYPISRLLNASCWFGQVVESIFDVLLNAQLEDNLAKTRVR